MVDNEGVTLKHLYEEIVLSKTELKNRIEASETRILLEIESLKSKVRSLEQENKVLRVKVESLDRNNRRNNLLIFGLEKPPQEISLEFLCNTIQKLINVNIIESDINNYYGLGRTSKSPLKVELVSQLKKQVILRNCNKLKGTKIFIVNDLTEKQREEFKALNTYKSIYKETTDKCFIKRNKLYIGNIGYTIEDLDALENSKGIKANSAPQTPTVQETYSEEQETVLEKAVQGKESEKEVNKMNGTIVLETPKKKQNSASGDYSGIREKLRNLPNRVNKK